MLRQVKKLLAFILALALVFTTFTSDYTSAKVFAEGENTEEQGEPEDQSEDEEESEDEDESEDDSEDEDSEDEESDDEESEEEASDDEESEEPKEEIPEEEIPEEIPEEEAEESEEDEEGRIVITYVVDGEGGSVSTEKESFDPESEEEITLEGSTAEAEEGYTFVGWTGGYLEETLMDETFVPDYTMITENTTFTASFEAIEEPEEKEILEVKDSTTVNGIKISLRAMPGVLPNDAKLEVKTIEDSDEVSISEDDVKEAVDAVTTDKVTATYSFDINIYSEEAGGYVQPEDGSVTITFDVVNDDISEAIADEDSGVAVYYIAEDGGGIEGVDKISDVNGEIEFNTDHFSVYTVIVTDKYDAWENTQLKIKVRDTNGKEIGTDKTLQLQATAEQIISVDEMKEKLGDIPGYSFYGFFIHSDHKYTKIKSFKFHEGWTSTRCQYSTGGGYSDCEDKVIALFLPDSAVTSSSNYWGGQHHIDIGFEKNDYDKYYGHSSVYAIVNGKKIDATDTGLDQQMGTYEYRVTSGSAFSATDSITLYVEYKEHWYSDPVTYQMTCSFADNNEAYENCLETHYSRQDVFGFDYRCVFTEQFDLNGSVVYHKNDGSDEKKSFDVVGHNVQSVDHEILTYAGSTLSGYEGHTFTGWKDEAGNDLGKGGDGTKITVNKDQVRHVYAQWSEDKVPVNLTYDFNDGKTEPVTTPHMSGDNVTIRQNPTRQGYSFQGWKNQDTTDTTTYGHGSGMTGTITMPKKDVTLIAQWEEAEVNYTVEWRERGTNNLIGKETETRQGVTGTKVFANQPGDKTITGYTYDEKSTDHVVVAADGSSVITLYFTANKHNITYVLADGSAQPDGYNLPGAEYNVPFGTEKTRAAVPDIAGYSFEGWTTSDDVTVADDGKFNMPDKDVIFTGKFTALQARYKVSWWEIDGNTINPLKNNDGVEYVIRDDAVTGDIKNAIDEDKKVTGYKFIRCDTDVKVVANTPNQMSEIKIYFEKENYKVYYRFDGTVPKGAKPYNTEDPSKPYAPQSYKYQETVDLATVAPVTVPAGYSFDGWRVENNSLTLAEGTDKAGTFPMPSHDVYLVGAFTANDGIPYQIRYWFQNVNDDEYAEDKSKRVETTGTTDDIVENFIKDYDGFTYKETQVDGEVVTSTIYVKGDGTLVVDVYYDRNTYKVTYSYDLSVYDPEDENPADPSVYNMTSVRFGALVPIAKDSTATGYAFDGWKYSTWKEVEESYSDAVVGPFAKLISYLTGAKAQQKYFEMPAGDVELIGSFTPNKYTVKYVYDKYPTDVTLPTLPDDGEEVEHDFGTQVIIADPVTAPAGYYFTGWKAPETVTVTDGKFNMPADNVIIKGSFAEKLKVRIGLAAPGDNTERLYNGQVQTPNTQIKFVVEGGDDPELAAYIQDVLDNAGDDVLGAFNTIRDMFVITAYAYDESLDLTPVADDEIPEGYEITGYTVVGEGGIDANKDRPGTADADKKLVGREKDYPIIFNGAEMSIVKDGVDLKEVADIAVVDADGNEVTDLSSGITIGYLTIIPREVTLTSGSASRVANGTPLTSPAVAITGDGFVAAVKDGETGDEIEVDKLKAEGAIGTITNPGSVENKIDEIGKFKTGFFRKDTNYVIKEVIGTLTITSGGGGGDDTPDTPSTPTTIPDAPVATAPAPTGAVLGAQRDVPVDGPAVLGARRAGTDDTTSRTARAFVVLVSAAVALSLLISGKKKREN